jgi:hypothetical protein
MEARHAVTSFARHLFVACAVSACSLIAPNDAELVGGRSPADATGGAAAAAGGGASGSAGTPAQGGAGAASGSAGAGTAGSAGGAEGGLSGSSSGDGQAGAGGASPPIPRDALLLWLRAETGTTEDGARGVSVWLDQSDAANDAHQTNAAARPQLIASGIGQLPALEFDGADDFLELPDGFADFSAGLSFFAVLEVGGELPVMGDCPAVLLLSNPPLPGTSALASDWISLSRSSDDVRYHVTTNFLEASGALTLREPHVVSVVHTPDRAVRMYLDGVRAATAEALPLPAVISRKDNMIAKTKFWYDINRVCPTFTGRIGELILFQRALDAEERLEIEAYLAMKWQLLLE